MSHFERLHPAIQHHIVNSLGWRSLRPLQERAIDPILSGLNTMLVAPTAGGKTEAATFPVFSRMLEEGWADLSVLYLCPLRALLNNLQPRLEGYARLVGRRVGMWHGDVGDTERRRILADPPDLLLTTPESLEVMLVSRRVAHAAFFRRVRAVVVDEVHAFAADDRGWHMLSVLERVQRLAEHDVQRIGLSATVGNPDEVLSWLAGSSPGARQVVEVAATTGVPTDVTVDHVGGLENAATVVSRLHQGEKRLVFCDSRSRVEDLAAHLRTRKVRTYVSHSSISVDERRQAEAAFASGTDCVIVATGTLELGIDVGDLDRVIQVDAPTQVASFLQRLGRTGRRAGTTRNCLFLATEDDALVRALALCLLWSEGHVEHVRPPASPLHLLAQQVMALCLQEGGIGAADWPGWIGRMPGFATLPPEDVQETLGHMIAAGMLFDDHGIWSIGAAGEATFGRRYFMDLLSAFTTEPLFTVRYGQVELGRVHQLTFATRDDRPAVLLLAGRPWVVGHVDWESRVAFVTPSEDQGKSRWLGSGQALRFELCQAVARVLAGHDVSAFCSARAGERLAEHRAAFTWLEPGRTAIVEGADGRRAWWTFAGLHANAALAQGLRDEGAEVGRADNYRVVLEQPVAADAMERLRARPGATLKSPVDDRALEGLKFSACLPEHLARRELEERLTDSASIAVVLGANPLTAVPRGTP